MEKNDFQDCDAGELFYDLKIKRENGQKYKYFTCFREWLQLIIFVKNQK